MDEDVVGRVKRDGGIRGLAETGYMLTSRRSRGYQARWTVWVVWTSKPPRRQVFRFRPKNQRCIRCGRIDKVEGAWRHREACIETKQSSEGNVSVRCSKENMDKNVLGSVIGVVSSVGVKLCFGGG